MFGSLSVRETIGSTEDSQQLRIPDQNINVGLWLVAIHTRPECYVELDAEPVSFVSSHELTTSSDVWDKAHGWACRSYCGHNLH
eukprot:5366415-Amphidinium_carterae.1